LSNPSGNNFTNSPVVSQLGAPTGSAVVASGATLQLNPLTPPNGASPNNGTLSLSTFTSKTVVLNGPGLGLTNSGLLMPTGAFENIANQASTWTGNVVLASDAVLNSTQNTVTFTGVVSGPGSLTKVGAGTIALAAADTYSGATTVTVGTLTLVGV